MNNLNRLKGENSKTEEILPQEDFIKFYKNLNSRDKDHNSVQKQIIEEFVSLKNNFNMSEVIGDLNNEISTDEIIEAIRSIRNGKTASTDLISNEMLKNAVPILIKPLQKLFNLIFKNETYYIKRGTNLTQGTIEVFLLVPIKENFLIKLSINVC